MHRFGAGFWYLSVSRYFVQATAPHAARLEVAMLEEVNAFYNDVVNRIDMRKTPMSHEYASRLNTLPVPATFTIDLGQRIKRRPVWHEGPSLQRSSLAGQRRPA